MGGSRRMCTDWVGVGGEDGVLDPWWVLFSTVRTVFSQRLEQGAARVAVLGEREVRSMQDNRILCLNSLGNSRGAVV